MGMDSHGSFGYGFRVTNKKARHKLDQEGIDQLADPIFDEMELIFHGDHDELESIVVIKESHVDVYGWQKPQSFSMINLRKAQKEGSWDAKLAKAAKFLGVSFEKGRWYLGCNYG